MLACDLHVHLDGSLRERTVVELARTAGLVPAATTDAEFARRLRFRSGMTLQSCLGRFAVTVGLLQSRRALSRVATELVEDCYLDGVRHAEVRFCPPLHAREGLTPEAAIEAVLAGLDEGVSRASSRERAGWLSARAIVSVLEGMDAATAEGLVSLAARYADAGVAGVDLAGDESLFNARVYAPAFRRAGDAGLGVTVHAGEGNAPEHVAEAVTELGASRIGHGVAAGRDPAVADLLASRRVTVEVCLSSNLHTGAVASLPEHPFTRLADAGVPVTLATDNHFFSSTRLSREYELAAEAGATEEQLRASVLTGADSAFLSVRQREKLRDCLESSL